MVMVMVMVVDLVEVLADRRFIVGLRSEKFIKELFNPLILNLFRQILLLDGMIR